MSQYQGWMRPLGSPRVHYVLDEHSLCRRWTVPYRFFRIRIGIGATMGRVGLQCVDCQRRYGQMLRAFTLPVEEPQPEFRFE
jgi:hypothetical protein